MVMSTTHAPSESAMANDTKKVIVIGDGLVGKTCLVSKITEGKFINNYHTTIGVEFGVKTVKRLGNNVKLCLWDIAGQDPFRKLMPQFGRGALAAIVMCDVTRRQSLEAAKVWKQSVDEFVFLPNGQSAPCILLVNKFDLPSSQRQVTSDEALEFSKKHGFVKVFETSVKDGTNINEALEFIVEVILTYEEDGQLLESVNEDAVTLSRTYSQGKRSTCCGNNR